MSRAIRSGWHSIIKVVSVDLALALLRLQQRPRPRVPRKCSLAKYVFCGFERFFVGRVRICLKDRTSLRTEARTNLLLKRGRCDRPADKQCTFIRICSD